MAQILITKKTKYTHKTTCGMCSNVINAFIFKHSNYVYIFFIPILFFNTKYFLVCPNCDAFKQISKFEFKLIKSGKLTESNFTLTNENLEIENSKLNEILINKIKNDIKKIIKSKKIKNKEKFIFKLRLKLIKKYYNENLVNIALHEIFN